MSQTLTEQLLSLAQKHQYGGVLNLKSIKQAPRLTMKRDAPAAKDVKEQQFAQKDLLGNVLPAPRDQGTISSPYKKSVRESMISGLNKVDRDGDNMVAGIVTEPLKAGLRLLRPDRYFENVRHQDDIIGGIGKLGMDAAMVAPAFAEGRTLLKGKAVGPIIDDAGRTVHSLGFEKPMTPVDKAKDKLLASANDILNRKFIPGGSKQVLPDRVGLHQWEMGGNQGVTLRGTDGKVYGSALGTKTKHSDWLNMGMINVDKSLQGNKLQDVLYQSLVNRSKELGGKGVMSGGNLASPAATVKAHDRFNREVFEILETDGIEHGLVGLTGHKNPNVIEDWMSKYKDIPKTQKQKLSINDVVDRIKRGPKSQQNVYMSEDYGGWKSNDVEPMPTDFDNELTKGKEWIESWRSNPEIQARMETNNQELLNKARMNEPHATYKDITKAEPIMSLHAQRPNPQSVLEALMSEKGSLGSYYPIGSGRLEGKAYVSNRVPVKRAKSVGIHEMTHQLTDGNAGISFSNKRLLREPFIGEFSNPEYKQAIINLGSSNRPYIGYLTEPTEVHARINELRSHYNMAPNKIVTPEHAASIIEDIAAEKTPLDPLFGKLIKDPVKLADVFNKMFTPALVAAGTYQATK